MSFLKENKCFVFVSLTAVLVLLIAGCPKKGGVSSPPAAQNGDQHAGWLTDFEKAKQAAKAQGKDLLVNFSGSDWCSWCIKLDKEVFSAHEFLSEADKHFVLVLVDFPNNKSKQSPALQNQNEQLAEKFQIQFFPTVLLMDADGNPYAKTGYQEGGPGVYLKHLKTLREQKNAP